MFPKTFEKLIWMLFCNLENSSPVTGNEIVYVIIQVRNLMNKRMSSSKIYLVFFFAEIVKNLVFSQLQLQEIILDVENRRKKPK